MQERLEQERRSKDRLECTVPITVRGIEGDGERYRFLTVTRDIGAGGLCAFAPRMMRMGERISMRIRFSRPGSVTPLAPELSVRGRVVRTKAETAGLCRFAVSFLVRN